MAGRAEEPLPAATVAEDEEENLAAELGSYKGQVRLVSDCEEEIMLLWAIQQPIFSKNNAFVSQSSLQLKIDACGRSLSILQSPSSLVRFLLLYFNNSCHFLFRLTVVLNSLELSRYMLSIHLCFIL